MDNATQNQLNLAIAVVVLGAAGVYLLLPHRHGKAKPRRVHTGGAVVASVALFLLALLWRIPEPADLLSGFFFYLFSLTAVAGGALTITTRDPIGSALWFASVVLSTSGLFLLAGAQFLAAGTVIVYAGAIIVTFLFVIMLAQMEGRAAYDRAARSPFRATLTCFLLFWALMYSIFHVSPPHVGAGSKEHPIVRTGELAEAKGQVAEVTRRAVRPTAQLTDPNGLVKPHVAGLGETLFTDHLMTVELAGTLLFVALIGALAIATPKPPTRPANRLVPTTNV